MALAGTLQPRLLAVPFAVEVRLVAPRLAAELSFAAGLAVPGELRSFCSLSRSRRTALFIFSRSRRASRRSLATSLRRSLLPVRMLPRIAPSSFSVTSSAVLMRAIARSFCSKRARAAAVTRERAAGLLAVALRVDAALGAAVFRALALFTGGIDAPLSWNCSTLCHRGSHSSRPQGLAKACFEVFLDRDPALRCVTGYNLNRRGSELVGASSRSHFYPAWCAGRVAASDSQGCPRSLSVTCRA